MPASIHARARVLLFNGRVDSLAHLHNCRGAKVGVLKLLSNKTIYPSNPAVLQFYEVATPSSIYDFDSIEGKQPKTP